MVDTNTNTDHTGGMNVRSIEVCVCTHFAVEHDPECRSRRGAGYCPCDTYTPGERQLHTTTLAALTEFINGHGYAPTVRELGVMLGLSSTATVQDRLRVLEQAGFIERKGPRAIKLMEAQENV